MDLPASRPPPDPLLVRLRRDLAFVAALCTAIALLLAALDRGGLADKLVYSFAIGLVCWSLVGGGRLLTLHLLRRLRRSRGLPPGEPNLGWRALLPLVLLALLAGPPLGLAIGDALTGGHSPSLLRLESASTRMTLVLTALGTLGAVFVLATLERLAAARARAERAQREAAETRLRLLQSQLEPHMLFNTLANLRVLIGLDPPRAQEMLDRLIGFLRSTLAASRSGSHALADEFQRSADYLALMAIRMGPRLAVALDLPPALRTLEVPALLLQPLVENAIRHGLEPQPAGGRIELTARREDQTLVLTVHDTGAGPGPGPGATLPGSGFGLAQVRQRLATLYGARATLELAAAGDGAGGTRAVIRLPLAPAETPAPPLQERDSA